MYLKFSDPSATASSNPNPQSTNYSNNLNGSGERQRFLNDNDSDELDKYCPICFMIFPPTMKSKYRNRHAAGHDFDDAQTDHIITSC